MDIESVITRQEYESLGRLSYDGFKVYTAKIVKLAVEEALKALPAVMSHLSQQAAYLRELSDEFYKNNPELANHKPLVSQIIERTEAANPGMAYKDVLSKASSEAKLHLGQLSNIKLVSPKPSRKLQ